MRVLLVKTSSLGDVIHALPAVTDAVRAHPGIQFDWVVEEAFAEVPAWHPAVDRVIPVALRRWRRNIWGARAEWRAFRRALGERSYDLVLDAQGLIKSALITRLARGPHAGLDRASAREPLAAWAYDRRLAVPRGRHAIDRLRQLFALALDYPLPTGPVDYGLTRAPRAEPGARGYVMFLHGTTWASKQWPEDYWRALARRAGEAGLDVRLPQAGAEEAARAQRIAEVGAHVRALPPMGLSGVAARLAGARGVVGVDTGLAHLAAALGVPGVTLYGATRPGLTGAVGPRQRNLSVEFPCAPCLNRECRYAGASAQRPACYETLPPDRVWSALEALWREEA